MAFASSRRLLVRGKKGVALLAFFRNLRAVTADGKWLVV